MNKGILLGLLLFPLVAAAQVWVGPDCLMTWDANPPGELVQGYRVYVTGQNPAVEIQYNVGDVLETTCSTVGLATQGRYEMHLTAYNPAGESDPSDVVPFVLVVSAPGTPGGVSAPRNVRVINIPTPDTL